MVEKNTCKAYLYYETNLNNRVVLKQTLFLRSYENKIALPEVYYTRDRLYKASIRVNSPVSKIEKCDIVELVFSDKGDYFYNVVGMSALSESTAEIELSLNAILTAGGAANVQFIYGHITRGHTPHDKVPLTPEPYMFTTNLAHWGASGEIGPHKESGYETTRKDEDLIVSSVDLAVDSVSTPDTDPLTWFFGNKEVGYNLQRIKVRPLSEGETTSFYVFPPGWKYLTDAGQNPAGLKLGGSLGLFYKSELVNKTLNYLVGLAYDDPVFSEYTVPGDSIAFIKKTPAGAVTSIVGTFGAYVTGKKRMEGLPHDDKLNDFSPKSIADAYSKLGVHIHNKKILKAYVGFTASVLATGQSLHYSGADLIDWTGDPTSEAGFGLSMWSDPSPGGRNYLTFLNVANAGLGAVSGDLTTSLASEGWQKPTVRTENSYGVILAERQINQEIFNRFCDLSLVGLSAGLGAAGGALKGAAATADAARLATQVSGYNVPAGLGARMMAAPGRLPGAYGVYNAMQGAGQMAQNAGGTGVIGDIDGILGGTARKMDLQNRNFGTVLQGGNNSIYSKVANNKFVLNMFVPEIVDAKQLELMFNTYGYTQYTDVAELQHASMANGTEIFALRPYFTYMQVPDCIVTTYQSFPGMPLSEEFKEMIANQFRGGVFIRKAPVANEDIYNEIQHNYYSEGYQKPEKEEEK